MANWYLLGTECIEWPLNIALDTKYRKDPKPVGVGNKNIKFRVGIECGDGKKN